jgi:hypothetical protein
MKHAATHAEWTRARLALRHILREPGALSERSVHLLRLSVLPQLYAALAMLSDDYAPDVLARWNSFLPAAVAAAGSDPELARVEARLRAGLAALSPAQSSELTTAAWPASIQISQRPDADWRPSWKW